MSNYWNQYDVAGLISRRMSQEGPHAATTTAAAANATKKRKTRSAAATTAAAQAPVVVLDQDDDHNDDDNNPNHTDLTAASPPSKRPKRLASLKAQEALGGHFSSPPRSSVAAPKPVLPSASSAAPLPSIKLFFTTTKSKEQAVAAARTSDASVLFFAEQQHPQPSVIKNTAAAAAAGGGASPSRIVCDACGIVIQSTCFSCDPCRFDVCLRCALPFEEKQTAQIRHPGHPHRLTQLHLQPASSPTSQRAHGGPTYSIFDKSAWGTKKTSANKQQEAANADLIPTLKPGEKPPEFFLSASERQQIKEKKRREAFLRESQEAQSELKAAFSAPALHPFLLPNESYARSCSPSASIDQEHDTFGKQLPLFPSEPHIRQSETDGMWTPSTYLDDSTPPITLVDTLPTFFNRITSRSKEESVSADPTAQSAKPPILCTPLDDNSTNSVVSSIVADRIQWVLTEQAVLLKTQHSPNRLWGGFVVFDSEPYLKLDYLADMPDPGVFDQPDAPYELEDALSLFARLASYQEQDHAQAQLWTSKYRPQTVSEVCGHTNWASFVHSWLSKWRDAMLEPELRLPHSTSRLAHEDDFNFSNQDDEESFSTSTMAHAMLIDGPIGSGKTSAIYACANQLNYSVIEINPSSDRSGQQIKNLFGEATQSHRASSTSNSKISGGRSSQTNHGDSGLTLILVDEVDNLFPEYDKGFFQALGKLLESSKRPIILTCESDRIPRELQHRSEVVHWPMRATPPWSIFVYLNLVLLAEVPTGALLLSANDAQSLADFTRCDIRHCLSALQMSVQTSSFQSFVEILFGLSTCLSNPASFWRMFGLSQSWALENLIYGSEITPVLLQPRRSSKHRLREKAPPLIVHLSWPALFGRDTWSSHDSLFIVDHDPFVFSDNEGPAPQSRLQASSSSTDAQSDTHDITDQDAFLESKLNYSDRAPQSPPRFRMPQHRLSSENRIGVRLFDDTVNRVADAFSLFDLCISEIGSVSVDTDQPGPFQRRNEMASAFLAKALVDSVRSSRRAGATAADTLRSPPSWVSKSVEEIILGNQASSSAALYKFIPPTVTSRSLQRDYLPLLLRMSFIEERRRQLNNKRRFQERLQLRSAAVSGLEVGLLTLLSQPSGLPAPLVPIDLS